MRTRKSILVTGGAGFVGSNFVLKWVAGGDSVVNLDLQTYAGNPESISSLTGNPSHILIRGDVADGELLASLLREHQPQAIVHFAAETHVDRSIVAPDAFLTTNVIGTFTLLEQARLYWSNLEEGKRSAFRFLHISTDEVYGSLKPHDPPFTESTPYAPNNPYAASKAASDHLVRAWFHTYGLPAIITNCSNNYGPHQFPEKLIPLMILNAMESKPLPVYGDGLNVRDWLFVSDHCDAICAVLENGRPGETYNVGGNSERKNIDVVTAICSMLDELRPDPAAGPRNRLITFVADRPGHDRRYAMDTTKLDRELGWRPSVNFDEGLRRTIQWYLAHPEWVEHVRTGAYRDWIQQNYFDRIAR
jgi:dTDP-glucose 4,6-dehydratase